jgi:transcriptional regulator with XRE-family HTH domain
MPKNTPGGIVKSLSVRLGAQLKALIATKGQTVSSVAESAGIHRQRLSSFLSGKYEMQSEALLKTLSCLGIQFEQQILDQISIATIGAKSSTTLGEDIEAIFDELSPHEQKVFLSSLIKKASTIRHSNIESTVNRLQKLKNSITFRRRGAC